MAKKLAAEKNNASEVETVAAEEKSTKKAAPKKAAPKKTAAKKTTTKQAAPKKAETKKEANPAAKQAEVKLEPVKVEQPKKKGGRPPMSEAEKAAAAKARAEAKAKEESLVPTALLQFGGAEVDVAKLIEKAKADFKASHKRAYLTELTLYIKPEENTAYYVANGDVQGRVSFS